MTKNSPYSIGFISCPSATYLKYLDENDNKKSKPLSNAESFLATTSRLLEMASLDIPKREGDEETLTKIAAELLPLGMAQLIVLALNEIKETLESYWNSFTVIQAGHTSLFSQGVDKGGSQVWRSTGFNPAGAFQAIKVKIDNKNHSKKVLGAWHDDSFMAGDPKSRILTFPVSEKLYNRFNEFQDQLKGSKIKKLYSWASDLEKSSDEETFAENCVLASMRAMATFVGEQLEQSPPLGRIEKDDQKAIEDIENHLCNRLRHLVFKCDLKGLIKKGTIKDTQSPSHKAFLELTKKSAKHGQLSQGAALRMAKMESIWQKNMPRL